MEVSYLIPDQLRRIRSADRIAQNLMMLAPTLALAPEHLYLNRSDKNHAADLLVENGNSG
jgi:hypothetical protein